MGQLDLSKYGPRFRRFLFRLRAAGGALARPMSTGNLLRHLPIVQRGCRFAAGYADAGGAETVEVAPSPGDNRLREYFDAHTEGRGIWKWRHYFDAYDRHFRKFVGRDVHVLEIGIFSGGSLEMWRDYFGDGCSVYGVDLDQACRSYENDYTKILIGDQADRDFWRELRAAVPRVDILIDDGGHKPVQQVVTLEEGLPHIRPGGVYVCEDIHGESNAFTAYLQGLVHGFNQFDRIESGRYRRNSLQRAVHSIHSYPFMTVIEKNAVHEELFLSERHGTEWQPVR